ARPPAAGVQSARREARQRRSVPRHRQQRRRRGSVGVPSAPARARRASAEVAAGIEKQRGLAAPLLKRASDQGPQVALPVPAVQLPVTGASDPEPIALRACECGEPKVPLPPLRPMPTSSPLVTVVASQSTLNVNVCLSADKVANVFVLSALTAQVPIVVPR